MPGRVVSQPSQLDCCHLSGGVGGSRTLTPVTGNGAAIAGWYLEEGPNLNFSFFIFTHYSTQWSSSRVNNKQAAAGCCWIFQKNQCESWPARWPVQKQLKKKQRNFSEKSTLIEEFFESKRKLRIIVLLSTFDIFQRSFWSSQKNKMSARPDIRHVPGGSSGPPGGPGAAPAHSQSYYSRHPQLSAR